ncbi:unnamed protein product [Enterobius vermicularis]|uniref:BAR domain-containing protein n=1 Tax=Enterobius vermicularis TaxID=51028 RepID=A0A0N4V4F2_ENTVE|nr:unnamed protein product [Enterobius vermicularis]
MSGKIRAVISRFSERLRADSEKAEEVLKNEPLVKDELLRFSNHIESKAKESIEGLELNNRNYQTAKEILSNRFATDLREFMVKVHKVVRQLKSSDDNINQGTTLMAIEKKLLQQVLIELKSDKEKRVSVNDQRESLGDTEQLLGDLERYVKIRQETDALVLKEDKKNYKQRGSEKEIHPNDQIAKKEKLKILELTWIENKDMLSLKLVEVARREQWTKRQVPNQTAKNCGSLGYLTPIFTKAMIFFRQL